KPAPSPAPFSIRTAWPCCTSSATEDGVSPTRYSLSLISLGTPIRIAARLNPLRLYRNYTGRGSRKGPGLPRMLRSERLPGAEAIEDRDDLGVAGLAKIGVKISDRAEILVRLQANRLVGFGLERSERVRGGDRGREHELAGTARANGAQGGARRGARRDAVVDDDRDAALRLRTGPRPDIEPPSPLDLFKLASADGLKLLLADASHRDNVLIADGDRLAAVRHSAHCELGLEGYADLADENQIKRRLQRRRDRRGHGRAAARQSEHHHLLAFVFEEPRREPSPCIISVAKRHGPNPACSPKSAI